jgi:hypothetical protein
MCVQLWTPSRRRAVPPPSPTVRSPPSHRRADPSAKSAAEPCRPSASEPCRPSSFGAFLLLASAMCIHVCIRVYVSLFALASFPSYTLSQLGFMYWQNSTIYKLCCSRFANANIPNCPAHVGLFCGFHMPFEHAQHSMSFNLIWNTVRQHAGSVFWKCGLIM